jgi:two-component system, OmpR family, catabolic regulation response regulator CreB
MILIVEDEVAIADTLQFALTSEGFATQWVSLAGAALELLNREPVELVIFDVGLPDMTGFEACKVLRRFSEVPVMFLTARADEIDRIVGLEIGADDYVVKPFSPREVVARVRAILKRSNGAVLAARSAEFHLDDDRLQLHYCGVLLKLTAHEFRMLRLLVLQPEHVFSREALLGATGAVVDAGYERNVDTHIKSLRAKLRELAPEREPIQTHRSFGYSYRPHPGSLP